MSFKRSGAALVLAALLALTGLPARGEAVLAAQVEPAVPEVEAALPTAEPEMTLETVEALEAAQSAGCGHARAAVRCEPTGQGIVENDGLAEGHAFTGDYEARLFCLECGQELNAWFEGETWTSYPAAGSGTVRVAHTYADGVCAVCGYRSEDSAEETGASPASAAAALTLSAPEKLGVGEKASATAGLSGCTYATSDAKVVAVNARTGALTAKKQGSAKITATAPDGRRAQISVRVYKKPTSIKLNVTKGTLGAGESGQLKATLTKGSYGGVTYTSDDASIATVDENGLITAKKAGKTTIRAKLYTGKQATCKLTVANQPQKVKLQYDSRVMFVGESLSNPAALYSAKGACSGAVAYASSDASVAAVSDSGKITAKGAGKAVITASTYNGLTASCAVYVASADEMPKQVANAMKPYVTAPDWFKSGSKVLKRNQYGYLYDIKTGLLMRIKRMGGLNHADVEPATMADTAKLLKIAGGAFSWNSHSCILIAGGKYVACAINTMPHGRQTIKDNGFDGQFCLHMVNSLTHGSTTVNKTHQAAIKAAYKWAHS